jgi:circadian clock protein KaiB
MTLDIAGPEHFDFELFVAGDAPNSAQALSNLRALCESRLPNRYTIRVVDVFLQPARAMLERVFMTPMLLRMAPSPQLRIVGTLSHTGNVVDALGLQAQAG